MNKMKEVAKLLGVELGEEFKIKNVNNYTYTLDKKGLMGLEDGSYSFKFDAPTILTELLNGEFEIEWRPKEGEECWFIYTSEIKPHHFKYTDNETDKIMFKRGFIKKTEKEAYDRIKELEK